MKKLSAICAIATLGYFLTAGIAVRAATPAHTKGGDVEMNQPSAGALRKLRQPERRVEDNRSAADKKSVEEMEQLFARERQRKEMLKERLAQCIRVCEETLSNYSRRVCSAGLTFEQQFTDPFYGKCSIEAVKVKMKCVANCNKFQTRQ